MINNHPYNVPQKKQPLSQSQILSENTNYSRHSLQYNLTNCPSSPHQVSQRHEKPSQVYSSAIFLKSQGTTTPLQNGISQQLPKYRGNTDQNQKFYSPNIDHQIHNSNNANGANFFKPPKNNTHTYMSPKISMQNSNSKMQSQRPSSIYRQQTSSTTSLNAKNSSNLTSGVIALSTDKQIQQLKNIVKRIQERLSQNEKQTQKLAQSQIQFLKQKTKLSESLKKLQLQKKTQDTHSYTNGKIQQKLKNIEKTIRQMGQDIHLINDKEEMFSEEVNSQLKQINNKCLELGKQNKNILQGKIVEISNKMTSIKNEMDRLLSSVNIYQNKSHESQSTIFEKLASININQQKIETEIVHLKNNKNDRLTAEPALHFKYLQEPIILKYIQSFQVKMPPKFKDVIESSFITIQLSELTYYIDKEGNILDNQRYYLLNGNNEKVKLSQSHLKELRAHNVLI